MKKRKNYIYKDEHASEIALDHVSDDAFDFVIDAANVEEIKEQCQKILSHL